MTNQQDTNSTADAVPGESLKTALWPRRPKSRRRLMRWATVRWTMSQAALGRTIISRLPATSARARGA